MSSPWNLATYLSPRFTSDSLRGLKRHITLMLHSAGSAIFLAAGTVGRVPLPASQSRGKRRELRGRGRENQKVRAPQRCASRAAPGSETEALSPAARARSSLPLHHGGHGGGAHSASVLLGVSLTGLRRLRGLANGSFFSFREGEPRPRARPTTLARQFAGFPASRRLHPLKASEPSPAANWAGGRNTAQARGDAQQPILALAGPQAMAGSTPAAGLGLQIQFSC